MNSPIKILHLEGTSTDAGMIRESIRKGNFQHEYLWVRNSFDFERELESFCPHVILSDPGLLFLTAKKSGFPSATPGLFIPLILISDSYSEKLAAELTKSGASDYFFKDRLQRLPLAILNAVNKHKAEKELREHHAEVIGNEKKFRALIENISDAILLLDINARIIYQSPSAERISGFMAADAVGKQISEFIHPADLAAGTSYLKQVILQPGISLQNSYRIRQKKGSFIWVEGSFTNFLHDENIGAITVNYRDITERKSAEDLLQKSEANLRTIFDNTNVSYVLSDKDFKIISFNATAVSTYHNEFKIEIKEGDNLLNLLPEERKAQSRERFERTLDGEKVNYELSMLQPDGSSTWYNVNMFSVRDDINNLLGFIISSENITHRKNIELERSKMLSDIVRHNKDLEQFAYIISHNLRSPVANILGLSALLESSPDMDKMSFEKCMSGLTASVKKLDEVIVDINHILQTRREINEKKEHVSFSELINDIKTSISSQIEKENITINTNFTINKFFTLKSYLYSIFFNLIYNSIKYRNPNTPAIINVQSKKINNRFIIEFRDNGLGIDLEAHKHTIFGLYKKFHKHIEGKGMGLYMVRTQVEILGGKISVASEVNKGTTFTLEFEE